MKMRSGSNTEDKNTYSDSPLMASVWCANGSQPPLPFPMPLDPHTRISGASPGPYLKEAQEGDDPLQPAGHAALPPVAPCEVAAIDAHGGPLGPPDPLGRRWGDGPARTFRPSLTTPLMCLVPTPRGPYLFPPERPGEVPPPQEADRHVWCRCGPSPPTSDDSPHAPIPSQSGAPPPVICIRANTVFPFYSIALVVRPIFETILPVFSPTITRPGVR